MAKRPRGTRPGQRTPSQRAAARPVTRPAAPGRPSGSLTDEELARAAEIEARLVEEERAAAAAVARGRTVRRGAGDEVPRPRVRGGGGLAAIAEEEYTYVRRDLRRIAFMFALIFGLLVVSFVVVQALGIAAAPAA